MHTGLPTFMRRFGLISVLVAFASSLWAQPQFRNAGAFLVSEEITNRVVQSGERITVGLALKNIGDEIASNLVATIQTENGVSEPIIESQDYGLLAPSAQSVARDFTFRCTAPSNSLLHVVLDLEDGGVNLGNVSFRFRVGGAVGHAEFIPTITINAAGPADIFPAVLSVTNFSGVIAGVSVTLSNLTHTYPDDLDVLLVSPGGDAVLLMSDACGSFDLDKVTLTFTDDAQATLPDNALPNPRIVRPTNHGIGDLLPAPAPIGPYAGVLSAFNGKEAYGDWKLYILDDSPGDGGALYGGWSLTITTLQPVDAAPTLKVLGLSDNNKIRFEVSGRPGYNYAIESASDPVQSFFLESFKMPPSGTRIFEYPITSTNEFFRASTDP